MAKKKSGASSSKKKQPLHKFRLTAKGMICVVFLIGVLAVAVYVFISRPDAIDRLSLTYLDSLTKDSLGYTIEESYADPFEVEDYTIYGEDLVLYARPYGEASDIDPLYGRIVAVKNIETGAEQTFTFSGGVDSGIDLGSLEPGVYEIYVYDGYTRKRVYMEEAMEAEPLITMRRDKEIRYVDLDASSSYLHKTGIDQDRNYLYLTVTSSLPKVKVIDVMIDPSGLEQYPNSTVFDPGFKSDLIQEAAAGYTFAEEIKSILTDAGLRVEVTRSSNEANSYFGSDSRVGLGYEKQAKVFLGLAMDADETPRPYVLSSPYTNAGLGNAIAHSLRNAGIELANVGTDSSITDPGSALDSWIVPESGTALFSAHPQLRESGGKATYAGEGEQWSANADFQNRYGMYGVIVFYASQENTDSQTYYLEHEGTMAQAIAQGILDYFNIPQEDTGS